MALFYHPNIDSSQKAFLLNEDESHHCLKTLRKNIGDMLELTDGKGKLFRSRIISVSKKNCEVEIIETLSISEPKCHIHMASALTKNISRMEFFLEKAVEIGIYSFTPVACKNSERTSFKPDRFQRIAISAMKQSYNTWLPEINDITDFKKFLSACAGYLDVKKYIAFQDESNVHLAAKYKKGTDALVLIGPEGDFSSEEIKFALNAGFEAVSLGHNRLRTETAALYACTAINIMNA